MRRLSVQLALAMVGSVLASLLIITGTQRVAEFRAYQLLPEEVRDFVPPPNLWPLWQRTRGGHQPGTGPGTGPGAVPGAGPGPGAGPSAGPSPAYEGPTQAVGAAGSDASDSNDDRLARNFLAIRDYQRESLLVGIVLASLVSVAFAWWLSRRIARPLEEVSKAATLVAGGDLAVRIPDSPALRRSSLETTRLAEDFNRMATALDSYEKERKAMIADIAHELRTPLTSMRLRLQALEDGLLPFEAREIASLNRSAELLSRLIEDLRTLSLADGGRLRLSMSNQDVTRIEILAGDELMRSTPELDLGWMLGELTEIEFQAGLRGGNGLAYAGAAEWFLEGWTSVTGVAPDRHQLDRVIALRNFLQACDVAETTRSINAAERGTLFLTYLVERVAIVDALPSPRGAAA